MKLKELRKVLDYSSTPINLIVLNFDGTNIKIEYEDFETFTTLEDFNDYEVTSLMCSKYFVDIFVRKRG